MKKIILIIFSMMVVLSVSAQKKQQVRPDWMLEKPVAGNATYEYVIEHGEGLTEKDALDEAINRIHQYYTRRLGQGIISTDTGVILQNGTYTIPFKKVCEYTENQKDGTYKVYVLCQVAVRGDITPQFEEFTACNSIREYKNYLHKKNVSAMVASVFIPGAGQMVKGHYGSGVFTLLGEMVFVGGAVTSYYLAKNELAVMRDYDVSLNRFNTAKKNYDIYRTVNIACISAAGVLYVYSLIRTGTMKQKFNDRKLTFSPEFIPTENGMASGVNLTLKF